ncbi:MAG TPA: 3'-5' exonuclease [Thermoleophilaceae bacterium]
MTGGSWRDARFIAIDVETTGLDPERDELISFAGIPIEGGRIIVSQEVHSLVRPRAARTGASTEIHGLRDYDLAGAPSAPEALAPLAALMHGRIPVVHAQWVERTFLRKAGCPLPRRIVDTAVLWRVLTIGHGAADPGTCSLSLISASLGLPAHRPHTAEGDTLTAAQVFLAMAARLETRGQASVRALTSGRRRLRAWQVWSG